MSCIFAGWNQLERWFRDVDLFADGVTSELATLTGSASSGYSATFQVGITL